MEDANVNVVMQFIRAVNGLDAEGVVELFADDSTYTAIGAPSLQKHQMIRHFQGMFDGLEPGSQLHVDVIAANGDSVLAHGKGTMRLKASRAEYNNTYVWFVELRDGKAVRVEEYFDQSVVERSFGQTVAELVEALQRS